MTTWSVVLEIDASPDTPLDLDEIDRLLQAAARESALVRYSSALHSLQFEIEAEDVQDALGGAITVWRVAARKSGTRRWPLSSAVITRTATGGG
jgi:hypothetical protein